MSVNKQTVENRIKKIIAEQLGIYEGDVVSTASLVHDLGADSLDVVELAMAIEDEFSFEAPDDEIEHLATVQQVIDYVAGEVGAIE